MGTEGHDEMLESFNDVVVQTQQSQKNYILKKPGDTIEDLLEDGVTPITREAKLLPSKQNMMVSQEDQQIYNKN